LVAENGKFNIDFYPNDKTMQFTITNTMGQTVFSLSKIYMQGQATETIDLSNQPVGIYIVFIKGGTYNSSHKIILQHNQ